MSEPIEGRGCVNCGQVGCKRDSWIKDIKGEPICWIPRVQPNTLEAIRAAARQAQLEERQRLSNEKFIADKKDDGKDRWDLLQWSAVNEVVKVATFGSKKYGDNNWKQGSGLDKHRLLAACMRHIYAWIGGQTDDPESGLHHLSHAAWNLLAIVELAIREHD